MGKTIKRVRKFVQKISRRAGLTEAQGRLAADVVHGICRASSCHLSEISRALGKDQPLLTTERRLSESLARPTFDEDALADSYLRQVAGAARRMPYIAVDPTELVKPYGRAFQNLDTVRDASDRRKPLEPGYWTVRIDATDDDHQTLPLYVDAFSTKADDYLGWNETFAEAVGRGRDKIGLSVGKVKG